MQIRTSINQIGLYVEARQLPGDKWMAVQLTQFQRRARPGFGGGSEVISPSQDEVDYLALIRNRGIKFEHVKATYAEDGQLTDGGASMGVGVTV